MGPLLCWTVFCVIFTMPEGDKKKNATLLNLKLPRIIMKPVAAGSLLFMKRLVREFGLLIY